MVHYSTLSETIVHVGLQNIIASDVNYSKDEALDNERFMLDGVRSLITAMKAIDPLFKELYKDIVFAGSYYENLRITRADEFDLQIVLDLPFQKESFTIKLANTDSTFVTFQLKESPQQILIKRGKWRHPCNKVVKLFDDEHFLLPGKTLTWFQNLIEEALKSDEFIQPDSVYALERKPQGQGCPAYTMRITGGQFHTTVDVDIVPVICTCCSKMPSDMHQSSRFRQLLQDEVCIQWFLVPKPPKDCFNTDPQARELWRSAFPEVEQKLLNNTGCLRKMIKIFKLLRDRNESWRKPIVSYYIKTFLLLKFDNNPDLSYWSEANLGKVFLEILQAFHDAMKKQFIPYYFNPKANLLSTISAQTAQDMSNRIEIMIIILHEDPGCIRNIFYFNPLSRSSDAEDFHLYLNQRLKTYDARPEVNCLDTLGGCCVS